MPVIGFLYAEPGHATGGVLAAEYGFRRGLGEMGLVDGQNIAVDYRSTVGQFEHLPAMAADLASRNVAVIVSLDSDSITRAAIAATKTIPIVFTTAGNPVQLGFVASWNRPGRGCGTLQSSSIRGMRLSRSYSIRRSKPPHSLWGSA